MGYSAVMISKRGLMFLDSKSSQSNCILAQSPLDTDPKSFEVCAIGDRTKGQLLIYVSIKMFT